MNRADLKEKISEISNSEFPLIDFFNDIGWLEGSKWFDTEKAYEDIEKIYNVFVYYKNKSKQLEKAIKILKAKLVPILLLKEVDTLEEYNEGLDDCDEYRLTQEEFDLLKKVFESVGDSDE